MRPISRSAAIERAAQPGSPLLYFVRHGETDWNAERRLQGQLDIPLNDVGRQQSAQCGSSSHVFLSSAPASLSMISFGVFFGAKMPAQMSIV